MYLIHNSATEDIVHVKNLGIFGAYNLLTFLRLETPMLTSLS